MTKEDLLARVWPEVTVTDETLTQTMHELRKVTCSPVVPRS